MKKTYFLIGVMEVLLIFVFIQDVSAELAYPYDNAPFTSGGGGNSAGRNSGGYLNRPESNYYSLISWIGTNNIPGYLQLDFEIPFTDGQGNDFAILTSSESWGYLADIAQFSFYLDGSLQGSFDAHLIADNLHEFDLPGDNIVANRIVITNITPDPPGINDNATMAFIDAGVAYTVPEPATLVMLGFGVLMLKRKS